MVSKKEKLILEKARKVAKKSEKTYLAYSRHADHMIEVKGLVWNAVSSAFDRASKRKLSREKWKKIGDEHRMLVSRDLDLRFGFRPVDMELYIRQAEKFIDLVEETPKR